MDTPASPRKAPFAFIIAILAAGSIMPLTLLVDAGTAPGGDGLQGFWPMVLVLGGATLIMAAAIIAGLVRKEQPSWLALLAPVILLATLWPLVM